MPRGLLPCVTGAPGFASTFGSGVSLGNAGDIRPVGEGVSELRIHYGPGYRIYLKKQGDTLVILLAGSDKSSQDQDIRFAKEIARNL
jgi:putative addiction module killer protein